ncbi:MAG: hypothetical protein JEY79_08590 [Pseudodesulfovibrio sp.]|nr:hypothetical protein [Pseudodesulfovibrio sp.]
MKSTKIALFIVVLLTTAFLMVTGTSKAKKKDVEECFTTSLHHTTRGMGHWYDAKDGFSAITGTPYKDLGCKNCHAASCNDCHLVKTDKGLEYSLDMAKKSSTCLKCHSREKATLQIDKERGTEGVHMTSMECADCHSAREVHGDGTCYESMRSPGAMDTKCVNCHTRKSEEYQQIPDTRSHIVHKEKLDCSACHVSNTMTCYNCHFGELKRTGKKPESFAGKAKDFLLLVKYNGKITSGTLQTLVGVDDYPFITYVPYFTHSVMNEGRKCEQCHNSEAVKALSDGTRYTPVLSEGGKLKFKSGVIPLVPDLLDWPFLKKENDKWVPFKPENKPLIQLGVYAEPFSKSDLEKMKTKQIYKK